MFIWKNVATRNKQSAQLLTNKDVHNLYYTNITCFRGHHHNGFMATGALGYTYVRLRGVR